MVTEPFAGTARATAVMAGLPDCAFVTVPHPISRADVGALRRSAEAVLDQVVEALTAG